MNGRRDESTRDRLRKIPLFVELPDDALDRLAGLSRILHVRRQEPVFAEGDPYRGMFVVVEGLAVEYRVSEDGRMLILNVCRPGDTLAEVPLFTDVDTTYPAHAKATREGELLFLPRERFVPFAHEHPQVAWAMLRKFAGRLDELSRQLEGVTLREVASRVARYLIREAETAGVGGRAGAVELTLPLAKGSIASYLGTAHETLSRTLARLARDGVIRVDGPRVTILDRERLRRLAS